MTRVPPHVPAPSAGYHVLLVRTIIIGTMMGVNGAIQGPDLQFQSSELIDDGLQRLFQPETQCRRKAVPSYRQR